MTGSASVFPSARIKKGGAMLRRIWVNNYKCFVNFEFKPQSFQFIMGANGTGKTALGEVLQVVRDFATGPYP
jgi:predicted ATPase